MFFIILFVILVIFFNNGQKISGQNNPYMSLHRFKTTKYRVMGKR